MLRNGFITFLFLFTSSNRKTIWKTVQFWFNERTNKKNLTATKHTMCDFRIYCYTCCVKRTWTIRCKFNNYLVVGVNLLISVICIELIEALVFDIWQDNHCSLFQQSNSMVAMLNHAQKHQENTQLNIRTLGNYTDTVRQ